MYVSSFKKNSATLSVKCFFFFLLLVALFTVATFRFIFIAAPYAENKARYLATDTINTVAGKYLRENEKNFADIIQITTSENGVSYATVNAAKLNVAKAELTSLINNSLNETTLCTVNIPVGNYLGLPFLSGIATPFKIKMHPVSRVLIDFEKDFYSAGINQTHLSLNLKVTVSVLVTMPGIRRSIKVETGIPAADAVFMGGVPYYFSSGGTLPSVVPKK